MKLVLTAVALACLSPAAAFAQAAPASASAPAPAPATPAAAAKFNLDSPIEALVADEKAKAVLAADLQTDIAANPAYDSFKSMSLHQVQAFAPDKLTDELLKKIEADLAAIK